tara:strand:+ start:3290 stop:3454 length:165 start_codon:yes stop_codon:yes gene_type:complete
MEEIDLKALILGYFTAVACITWWAISFIHHVRSVKKDLENNTNLTIDNKGEQGE